MNRTQETESDASNKGASNPQSVSQNAESRLGAQLAGDLPTKSTHLPETSKPMSSSFKATDESNEAVNRSQPRSVDSQRVMVGYTDQSDNTGIVPVDATLGVDNLEDWLSSNIIEFMKFIQTYSTSGDREKRWAIIRYVQRQTSIFLGQSSTQHPSQVAVPFGSFTYGMYLPWASDLDIVLTEPSMLENPEVQMKRLADHFSRQKNHCIQAPPVVVSRTRVPFIQLLLAPPHHARGLIDQSACGLCRMGYVNLCPSHSPVSVQLSLNVPEHAGLISTVSVNHLVAHYPVVRGLVLVLKHILVSENLNSPFEGGLSSHSLIILVSAFLRHFHPHDHSLSPPGLLFLQLLCWYGGIEDGHHRIFTCIEDNGTMHSAFDPSIMTVDVRADSDCYRPKSTSEATQLLYVVDPLDQTHNAARSMWRWPDLKRTLTGAYWHVYSGKWWTAMGASGSSGSPSPMSSSPSGTSSPDGIPGTVVAGKPANGSRMEPK